MSDQQYISLSNFYFSKLHFRGILGGFGVFVLQPGTNLRIGRFNFWRKGFARYLSIEATELQLLIRKSVFRRRYEVFLDEDLIAEIPLRDGVAVWKSSNVTFLGQAKQDHFIWRTLMPDSTSTHNILCYPYLGINSKVFNFIINDSEAT